MSLKKKIVIFLAHLCNLHGWLICVAFCLPRFVQAVLCITSTIQNYVVHHWPALCTTAMRVHHGAQGAPTFWEFISQEPFDLWSPNCHQKVCKSLSQSCLVASLRVIGRCAHFNVKLLHFVHDWHVLCVWKNGDWVNHGNPGGVKRVQPLRRIRGVSPPLRNY